MEKGGRQTALDNYGYEGAKAAQPQGEVRCKECNAITRMTRADLLKYLDEQQQSMLCRVCGEDVKAPAEARAAHLVRLLESLGADQGGMEVDVQELDYLVRNSVGELSDTHELGKLHVVDTTDSTQHRNEQRAATGMQVSDHDS